MRLLLSLLSYIYEHNHTRASSCVILCPPRSAGVHTWALMYLQVPVRVDVLVSGAGPPHARVSGVCFLTVYV